MANWQRPTDWSAETVCGMWYAECDNTGRSWKLWNNCKKGADSFVGTFTSLSDVKRFVADNSPA